MKVEKEKFDNLLGKLLKAKPEPSCKNPPSSPLFYLKSRADSLSLSGRPRAAPAARRVY